MDIRKVHCFFEQSGTFKNEFLKLGIPSEDYDIQNEYKQTENVIDLFAEIEKAYINEDSIFDRIEKDDLIMAFFPCIYFTGSTNPCYYTLENNNYKNLSLKEKINSMLDRSEKRKEFFHLLLKLVGVCLDRGIKLIIENPYSEQHYLKNNFFKKPDIFDKNRAMRGDKFKKPTGYWFFNMEPTHGCSIEENKKTMVVFKQRGGKAGTCSKERSEISSTYARNFICDFILGKVQKHTQLSLF